MSELLKGLAAVLFQISVVLAQTTSSIEIVNTATSTPVVMASSSPIAGLPPIMLKIAECESNTRQFNEAGEVLRGRVHPADLGIFQINSAVHAEEAEKLGIDIFTLEGNVAFAKLLFERNGTRDWLASKKCWK